MTLILRALWAVVLYAVIVGSLGDMLELAGSMFNLSPFHHVPNPLEGEFTIAPLAAQTIIAIMRSRQLNK